jgi:hypothetical protein
MAQKPSTHIINQLNSDKMRADKTLEAHRARLKELEGLDQMIWGRQTARTRAAIGRAEQHLSELRRLFDNIK